MTRKQLVLKELLDARRGKQYRYNSNEMIPVGWVPSWIIVSPGVGGCSGLRRLRELRASGIKIQHRFFYRSIPGGGLQKTDTTIYNLVTDPFIIDMDSCSLMPSFNSAVRNGIQMGLFV